MTATNEPSSEIVAAQSALNCMRAGRARGTRTPQFACGHVPGADPSPLCDDADIDSIRGKGEGFDVAAEFDSLPLSARFRIDDQQRGAREAAVFRPL